jgi:hypothetical protein
VTQLIARTIAILAAGAFGMLLVFSRRARRVLDSGVAAAVDIERKYHVFSAGAAVLAAFAALVAVAGVLLMWTLSNVQFG